MPGSTGNDFRVLDQADVQRRELLHGKIRDFNAATSPHHRLAREPGGVRALDIFVHDDAGELVAGLSSDTYWDWWEITYLWVDPTLRGQGYGRRLMACAEAEARRRGCRHAQLTTFSFQAPGFYARLGFVEAGQLEGYPPGGAYYLLCKELG